MAYVYADWCTQSDLTTRLSGLRLHIAEVSALMAPSQSADGVSNNPAHLTSYLKMLLDQERSLSAAAGGTKITRGVPVGI